jgi:hypothetical protein
LVQSWRVEAESFPDFGPQVATAKVRRTGTMVKKMLVMGFS